MLLPTAHSTSASKKIKLYSVPFVSVSTVLLFKENSRGYILQVLPILVVNLTYLLEFAQAHRIFQPYKT
jgi:hypothetical protein